MVHAVYGESRGFPERILTRRRGEGGEKKKGGKLYRPPLKPLSSAGYATVDRLDKGSSSQGRSVYSEKAKRRESN